MITFISHITKALIIDKKYVVIKRNVHKIVSSGVILLLDKLQFKKWVFSQLI